MSHLLAADEGWSVLNLYSESSFSLLLWSELCTGDHRDQPVKNTDFTEVSLCLSPSLCLSSVTGLSLKIDSGGLNVLTCSRSDCSDCHKTSFYGHTQILIDCQTCWCFTFVL